MKSYNYKAKAKKFFGFIERIQDWPDDENTQRAYERELEKPWPDMEEDINYAMSLMMERAGLLDKGSPVMPDERAREREAFFRERTGGDEIPEDEKESPPWFDEMVYTFMEEGASEEVALFRATKANALMLMAVQRIEDMSDEEREAYAESQQRLDEEAAE